jgi:AraC-like DNA-binding protein
MPRAERKDRAVVARSGRRAVARSGEHAAAELADQRPVPVVITLVRRERVRTVLKAAFPRRRAIVHVARTADDVAAQLRGQLVDAVLIDLSVGEDAIRASHLAGDFPAHPFFALSSAHSSDAPMIARAIEAGVVDVLLDGIDDPLLRDRVQQLGFTRRFAAALELPPPLLGLGHPLQREVWSRIVAHGGRPVRTDALAKAIGMSREHLSRSFARERSGQQGEAPTLKRVIDLVRIIAAAELSKNPGHDVKDVAAVLEFASTSHLSVTSQRLVGAKATSLARLRTVDLLDRFARSGAGSAGAA